MATVSQAFKDTIKAHLDKFADVDFAFAMKYDGNEKKSIDECCEYILGQVAHSGQNGFTDEEIYGMAIHYYDEDDLGDWPKATNSNVIVNHHVELTPEEVEEAKEAAKNRITQEEVNRIKAEEKKAQETAKKKAEEAKAKAAAEGLLSLFDMTEQ